MIKIEKSKITEDKLEIIYKNAASYGIRNSSGFLFLFPMIESYSGQMERYNNEVEKTV